MNKDFTPGTTLNLPPRHSEFFIGISKFLLQFYLILLPSVLTGQVPSLKVGLLADIQYCNCQSAGARTYEQSLGRLKEAVLAINGEKVNFSVETGDLIDRDFASYLPVEKVMNTLVSGWIFVPGNHDFNVADSLKKQVWNRIPAKKGYWSEIRGDVRLIYLNGFENSVAAYSKGTGRYRRNRELLDKLGQANEKNAFDWNGGLGRKQLDWIRLEVAKANKAHQKLIVFGHQPINPGEEHSLWDSDKLIGILAGYRGHALYICGHKHSGGDHTLRNIRIINLKGMVEQTVPSFGILSVYPERWEIKGFGAEGSYEGRWGENL
jgi:3',5'-cyclic AMP phosphodiesterase CpdA